MWKGTLVMMSFGGLGDATGGGEVFGGVDSTGVVGAALGVTVTVAVEGLASGDWEANWLGCVQPVNTKTSPATTVAGTPPPLNPSLRRTFCRVG
jgi:hypothetical protein